MINLEISTILSNRTKEGMINFSLDNGEKKIETQWDIPKAKHVVQMLHEAIEAAISDAMIYKFFRERVGMPEEKAVMVVRDFREIRQGSKEVIDPH